MPTPSTGRRSPISRQGVPTSPRRSAAGSSRFDAQIAAIATVHEAAVATRNDAEFDGCNIEVVDPWQD